MGWMSGKVNAHGSGARAVLSLERQYKEDGMKPDVSFVEDVDVSKPETSPTGASEHNLPFISAQKVSMAYDSGLLWVVIDDVVYDCTQFADTHPGGADVLEPFMGSDCSWQFWRFHGKNEMEDFGVALRIGWTRGVRNKYKERPRFIGLRKLWDE